MAVRSEIKREENVNLVILNRIVDDLLPELYSRQMELVIYQRTLRESVVFIKQMDEENDSICMIQNEVQNIGGEIRNVMEQIHALNAHNNKIHEAMMTDSRRASQLEIGLDVHFEARDENMRLMHMNDKLMLAMIASIYAFFMIC